MIKHDFENDEMAKQRSGDDHLLPFVDLPEPKSPDENLMTVYKIMWITK